MGRFLAWLIESSLLIMMIFGIRRLFAGKIPYVAVYALWLVVLVRFLIPVNFISTPVSVANFVSETVFTEETAGEERTDPETMPGEGQEEAQASLPSSGNGLSGNHMEDVTFPETSAKGSGSADLSVKEISTKEAEKEEVSGEVQPDGMHQMKNTEGHAGRFLDRIWFGGAVVLFLMIFLSNARLLCKLKKSRVFYGQRENIKIYTVYDLKNPCLYGFFRPAIYVPKGLISSGTADEEDLKQMIAHEFVHYRHGDHIWSMLRMVLVSVYWFHPFLWLAASYSKKDAELFCDETTIRLLGEEKRFCYGEMLVRLAGDHAWGDFFYSMMPMSRRGKEMEQRIRAISRKKRYPKWILIPMTLIVLVAVSVTCSTGFGPLAGEKDQVSDEGAEDVVSGPAVSADSNGQTVDAKMINSRMGWQNKFDQAASTVFRAGSYGTGTSQSGENALTDGNNPFTYAATPQEAFNKYILIFTDAVNTGDTSNMDRVLAMDSEAYEQQCALVKNYYKRGICEEVKSFSISSVKMTDPSHAEICSKEKIKVSYADGSVKIVRQKYRYLCEQFTARSIYTEWPVWEITKMEALA